MASPAPAANEFAFFTIPANCQVYTSFSPRAKSEMYFFSVSALPVTIVG